MSARDDAHRDGGPDHDGNRGGNRHHGRDDGRDRLRYDRGSEDFEGRSAGPEGGGGDGADGSGTQGDYGGEQFDVDAMRRLRSELDSDVGRFGGAASLTFERRVEADSIIGGDQFVFNMDGRQARRVSWYRVSEAEAVEMERVYVRPPCADTAEDILHRRRVLVISGPRHSGRRFLAAALAVTVAPADGECRFLRPGTDPDALTAQDVRPGCALVLEVGTASGARPLTGFALARLSGLLADRRAYLVLTVEDTTRLPEDVAPWSVREGIRADPAAVLRRHLRYRLPTGRVAHADVLSADPEVKEWLAGGPSPGEIASTARALAGTADGSTTVAACLAQVAARAEQTARELLEEPGTPRELAIAIAFFGGFPYPTVHRLENHLADLVHQVEARDGVRPRPFLTETRKQRLDAVRATVTAGTEHTRYGSSPTEVVDFTSPGLATALVDVVWRGYDDSALLMRWLSDLVHDPVDAVRRRAAVSLGRLSLLGFAQLAEQVFQPWALSPDHRDRTAAATALSVAVHDPSVAGHALGLIESWSSGGSRYRRMTAGLAWGLAVSPVHPVAGLQGLGELLDTTDPGVAWSAKVGLSAAFAGGLSTLVLDAMGVWLEDARDAAKGNLLGAFLRLCHFRGGEGRPDAANWPTALWLFDRAGRNCGPNGAGSGPGGGGQGGRAHRAPVRHTDDDVVDLWRAALSYRATSADAVDVLESWIRQADRHGECREALLDLVDELIDDDGDLRRLHHRLGRLARHPSRSSYTAQLALAELEQLL